MLLTVTAMVASASLCRLDAFGTRPSGDAIRVRSPWLAQQRAGEANRGDRVDRAVPLRAASTPSDFGQPSPQGHKQLRSEVPSQRPPSPVREMQRDDRRVLDFLHAVPGGGPTWVRRFRRPSQARGCPRACEWAPQAPAMEYAIVTE